MRLVVIVLLVLFAGAGGCSSPAPPERVEAGAAPAVTRLSAAEALLLADEYVGSKLIQHRGPLGYPEPFDFAAYPDRKATLGQDGKTWWVHYDRNRKPGDHFAVRIDDATGEIQIVGGA
jgi:hypothetical protein